MISKVERLQDLARVSPDVFPPTAWSPSEIDSLGTDSAFYLRVNEGFSGKTGPLTADEARHALANFGPDIAAQPFIEAQLSGAMFASRDGIMIEAVAGDARRMLRGGIAGEIVVLAPDGLRWSNGVISIDTKPGEDIAGHLSQLASPYSIGEASSPLEWIVDLDGRTWLVDLKSTTRSFVRWNLESGQSVFEVGGSTGGRVDDASPRLERIPSEAGADLHETSLSEADLVRSTTGTVRSVGGAVLSHLVTRYAAEGRLFSICVKSGMWQTLVES